MAKKVLTIIITLLVLLGLSFGVTYFLNKNFLDYAFIVGILVSIAIWFFTSKGGLTSKNAEMMTQSQTGIKVETQKYEFSPNLAFITSLVYTLVTLGVMVYEYKNYF
jgi:Na+/H+ antiporter NhaB